MKQHYFSSDTDLTLLANQLDLLAFELSEADIMQFQELVELRLLKNVSMYVGGRTFRVRLCIGGKQHVIGVTRNGPNAARYADMARLFFWPYRLRDKRLPEDSEFNYGLEATQREIDCNDNAVRVLEKIRDHLIYVSKLAVTDAESESKRANRKDLRETRRTVRGELLFIHKESTERAESLEATLKGFESKLDTNTHLFEQCKLAFGHILEKLVVAEKQRAELRRGDENTPPHPGQYLFDKPPGLDDDNNRKI